MEKFLSFDTMVTPLLVKIFFYLNTIICVLLGFGLIISGCVSRYGGAEEVLLGLLLILFGPLLTRLWAEMAIVIFKIHENLIVIRDK